ncbi:hypothetical protein [Desemzia sp. FAM 23991]|uniref:hypothetical protein n=1 Tax=unclassified Desemzia TaxID=2685243 RepID=UPI0038877958
MNKKRKELYIDELKTQINFALYSVEGVNEYLNLMDSGQKLDSEKFWYYAQSLIVYSGNISKILWGINGKDQNKNRIRKNERKALREELGVNDNSLLEKRFLRNALEHIDEKLEDFTVVPQTIIMNKNFGPVKGMISFGDDIYDVSKQKNLRHYDQYSKTFYFYDEGANIENLYKSILQLKESIEKYEVINDDFYR